jgi:arylsulfatase B
LLYTVDPTEHHNIADQFPDVVKKMRMRLNEYKATLVPAWDVSADPKSNPKYYNGTWSPGWC